VTWKGKRVLVTGAGDFIGSRLTKRLVGAKVRAFVHCNAQGGRGWLDQPPFPKEIEVVAGDTGDRDSVQDALKGVDVIFHLAALIAIPYCYSVPGSIEGDRRNRPSQSEVECLLADNTLARTLLGWKPRVSLEEGLKPTIEWTQKNLERYRPQWI
jgi:nucleoside-diphosphate-sugar epimerase